jgi:hypothetical protein
VNEFTGAVQSWTVSFSTKISSGIGGKCPLIRASSVELPFCFFLKKLNRLIRLNVFGWYFIFTVTSFMANLTQRYQQFIWIVPRLFKTVQSIDKVILTVMNLQAMDILTNNAFVLIPVQDRLALLFPLYIK